MTDTLTQRNRLCGIIPTLDQIPLTGCCCGNDRVSFGTLSRLRNRANLNLAFVPGRHPVTPKATREFNADAVGNSLLHKSGGGSSG